MIIFKLSAMTLMISFIMSCHRSHNSDDSENTVVPLKAEILIADVSSDQCLNLEKLTTELQNPQFAVPAAIMNTNLKSLNEISRAKTEFFSYANFYYKITKANELNLFTSARQSDCKTIQLLTASNEVLTYNITDHAENYITFSLSDNYDANIPDFEKKALEDRLEPYEYTVTYLSTKEITVVEKFRSIDPLCDSKKPLKFEVTKNIAWAPTEVDLPKQYQVDPYYLGLVQQALEIPSADILTSDSSEPVEPIRNTIDVITVDEILKIMSTPIRNELKLCS